MRIVEFERNLIVRLALVLATREISIVKRYDKVERASRDWDFVLPKFHEPTSVVAVELIVVIHRSVVAVVKPGRVRVVLTKSP